MQQLGVFAINQTVRYLEDMWHILIILLFMRAMTKQKERETCILQCKTVMNVLQVVMLGTLTTNMEVHRAVSTDAVVHGGMMYTFALSTLGVLSIAGIVRYQEVIRSFLEMLFYKGATIKLEERETVILVFKIV